MYRDVLVFSKNSYTFEPNSKSWAFIGSPDKPGGSFLIL